MISDLSSVMFTEVSSYRGIGWEAGEEVVEHSFSAADDDDVTIRYLRCDLLIFRMTSLSVCSLRLFYCYNATKN